MFLALNIDVKLNNVYFDWQSKHLAQKATISNSNILIVAIDETSIATLEPVAGKWPWPRSIHAELTETLIAFGANHIAFDVLFIEKDLYRPDDDSYFKQIVAEYSNISLAGLLLDPTSSVDALHINRLMVPSVFASTNQIGLINANLDEDSVLRSHKISYNYRQKNYLSLPATIFGKQIAATSIRLNWLSLSRTPYETRSYSDVFKAVVENNTELLNQFKGKTIFIGATANGLYDSIDTPVHTNLPGVYALATSYDNLVNDNFLKPINKQITYLISILLALPVLLFCSTNRQFKLNLLLLTLLFIGIQFSLALASYYAQKQSIYVPFGTLALAPIIVFIATSLTLVKIEIHKKRQIQSLFGRFVDPNVVQQLILGNTELVHQNGVKCNCTVLFSDIRGFTTLSETHSPDAIFRLLNQYFSAQVDVVFRYQGTLDKFIGDCIMAFWGAPINQQVQTIQALECALAMEQALITFKQTLPPELSHFDIGIGLHFGEVLAGFVGTEKRVDYTVLGDAVNLASRIEGLTKEHDRILLSGETVAQIRALTDRYDFVEVGEFQVKGRAQHVTLYTVKREKA